MMSHKGIISFLFTPLRSRRLNVAGKRIVDFVAALVGMILLAPFFLLIAARIRRDSPGPIFYWGPRTGKNGKPFRILKFRTMYARADSFNGPRITGQGDARITPFGQWLRDTKVNELPQLWNVFVGDMSLVGPRPEDPEIVATWPEDARREILSIRPGITSPASVVFRDEEKQLNSENVMEDYLRTILPSKLRLDQLYVRNFSLLSDLDVIFWTFMISIPQIDDIPIPESRLYWGPFSFFFSRLFNWFVIDFVISFFSIALVAGIWRTITPLDIGWGWGFVSAVFMAVVFSIYNLLLRNHLVYWSKANPSEAFDVFLSTLFAVVTIWLVDLYVVVQIEIPNGLFIFGGILACGGFIAARFRERILTGLAWRWLSFRKTGTSLGERVLIIGAGELGEFAAWILRKGDFRSAFSIIGLIDDDPRKQNMNFDGMRILGATRDIPRIVQEYDPGLILFAISNISAHDKARILDICRSLGVRIVLVPDIMNAVHTYFKNATIGDDVVSSNNDRLKVARVREWFVEVDDLLTNRGVEEARQRLDEIQAELNALAAK